MIHACCSSSSCWAAAPTFWKHLSRKSRSPLDTSVGSGGCGSCGRRHERCRQARGRTQPTAQLDDSQSHKSHDRRRNTAHRVGSGATAGLGRSTQGLHSPCEACTAQQAALQHLQDAAQHLHGSCPQSPTTHCKRHTAKRCTHTPARCCTVLKAAAGRSKAGSLRERGHEGKLRRARSAHGRRQLPAARGAPPVILPALPLALARVAHKAAVPVLHTDLSAARWRGSPPTKCRWQWSRSSAPQPVWNPFGKRTHTQPGAHARARVCVCVVCIVQQLAPSSTGCPRPPGQWPQGSHPPL